MVINAPENIIVRSLELHEAGQLSKTDICETIKTELNYVLSREELGEIIVQDKDKKLKH